MIRITDTPQHAGIELTGDGDDLEELYDALYQLMYRIDGDAADPDGDLPENALNVRLMALCYHLRHAHPALSTMMDQTPETEANYGKILRFPQAMTAGAEDEQDADADDDGESIRVDEDPPVPAQPAIGLRLPWPEIIFCTLALNHYLGGLYSTRKKAFKDIEWTPAYATVRKFQISVLEALCQPLSPNLAARVRGVYKDPLLDLGLYCTQYIDQLNVTHLRKNGEQRLRFLSQLPTLITNQRGEYYELQKMVSREAFRLACQPWELTLNLDEPATFD